MASRVERASIIPFRSCQRCLVSSPYLDDIEHNTNYIGVVVGLTGGIATGKSTVSSLLKASHVPIVDADVLAREVVAPGTSGLKAIVRAFGSDVLQLDGSLDRAKLGALVFADEAQRRKLNAIVHPAVRRAMLWDVLKHWVRGERMCVVDVPLLVESKLHRFVGKVVVVYWCVWSSTLPSASLALIPCSVHQLARTPAPASHGPR